LTNPRIYIDYKIGEPEPKVDFKDIPKVGSGITVLGAAVRVLGTVGLLLIPESAPGEGPNFHPYVGHGNKKENSNPHIVYQFTFVSSPGDPDQSPVLKYGISDVYRYVTDRPENQLLGLQKKYGMTVRPLILMRTTNREFALMFEHQLVTSHVEFWKTMPREQLRPTP
jgi:hypothetical protein